MPLNLETNRSSISRMLFLILTLLLAYAFVRLIFLVNNLNHFEGSFFNFAGSFIYGARFDLSAIFLTNLPFFILALFPFPGTADHRYRFFLKIFFLVTNGFFLLLNLADAAYFPFTSKRMQFDAFLFLSGEKGREFYSLLPTFLAQYWYLWLIYIAMIWMIARAYKYAERKTSLVAPNIRNYLRSTLLFIAFLGLSVVAIRGGLQLRPLKMINAAEMMNARFSPLILNSSFSIISTYKRPRLKEKNFFTENETGNCNKGIYTCKIDGPFTRENVVIIIIESFSKKYLGLFNKEIRTPFLDSIAQNSRLFVNAYANARESVQGIPAILSSIPSWQDDAFIFSSYSNNNVSSFPNLLKKQGYSSSFFHGGTNGTMAFDAFSSLAGFDHYFGRTEFDNENEYDGYWGIWDEPFLQFMADKLSSTKGPFISSVFTLTPHHPFVIPEKYKNRFSSHDPVANCMEYLDYSLSQFFEKIRKADWYKNTVFIITADHTAPVQDRSKSEALDDYRIPIIFHRPDGSLAGVDSSIANQIDILPSTLQLLNYPGEFFSFGTNLFKNDCPKYAITYASGLYQLIEDNYCLQFNGDNSIGLYNWKTDPAFRENLIGEKSPAHFRDIENSLKKKIQLFNNSMIRNKMVVR